MSKADIAISLRLYNSSGVAAASLYRQEAVKILRKSQTGFFVLFFRQPSICHPASQAKYSGLHKLGLGF